MKNCYHCTLILFQIINVKVKIKVSKKNYQTKVVVEFEESKRWSSLINSPAILALINVTVDPATIVLTAIDAKSDLRSGTKAPSVPNCIPIAGMLENPQSAKVDIAWDRF